MNVSQILLFNRRCGVSNELIGKNLFQEFRLINLCPVVRGRRIFLSDLLSGWLLLILWLWSRKILCIAYINVSKDS